MPRWSCRRDRAQALLASLSDSLKMVDAIQSLALCLFILLVASSTNAAAIHPPPSPTVLPSDANALLMFKSKADLGNNLHFTARTSLNYCHWQGVTCLQGRVMRLVLEGLDLGGVFGPDTLTRLDQLRVLSLQNDSLVGPIPDLSKFFNLKALFLDHNSFNGSFPPSLSSLHRIRTLDFSYNNLTGPLPAWLTKLDRLYYLQLESNRFNGTIPPLNQSTLQRFNVSCNNLSGAIPVTPILLHFEASAFALNPGLCGEILHKECHPSQPFFGPPEPVGTPPPPVGLGQTEQVQGVDLPEPCPKNHKRTAVILGFSSGVFVLISSLLCFVVVMKKQRKQRNTAPTMASDSAATAQAAVVMRIEEENELEEKVKKVQGMQVAKSGSLVFCAGEAQLYTLEQLMRASAELLGRGSIGTTYKAVLDNRLIVSVKRLDAGKTAVTDKETYERHMESVGGLRHPNLVPLRAYFQAQEERLLIYDYQPNGSLFSLIHGTLHPSTLTHRFHSLSTLQCPPTWTRSDSVIPPHFQFHVSRFT